MSLSSFLLKSTGHVDTELDALFKSKPQPSATRSVSIITPAPQPTRESGSDGFPRKRKLDSQPFNAPQKRPKPDPKEKSKTQADPEVSTQESSTVEHDQDENSDLEAAYLHSRETNDKGKEKSDDESDDDEDIVDDPSKLVHEALAGAKKIRSRSKTKKEKYVPTGETSTQRDQRTIFIGNLTLETAQKRPLQKQLQRHILSFISTAKIESLRFRSVPFSSPSAAAESTTADSAPAIPHKNSSQREHSRSRASSWRSNANDTPADVNPEKTFLTPNQKKKYLFLTNQFHNSGGTVHAYIVFAHPPPSTESRSPNLPPLQVMDPYEAAKEAVKKADGSLFQGRSIRVDFVGKSKNLQGDADNDVKGERAFQDADPKTTLFVGNLDLGAQEDDLRAFFDTLMKTERGSSPVPENEDVETKKSHGWVVRVRIIRDKDTQLGKGFGYVQFADRECVDEILTFEPSQLKFAKRKLRVQRCKTLPGTKLPSSLKSKLSSGTKSKSKTDSSSSPSKPADRSHSRQKPPTPIIIPKGDPSLGKKLASMSKQERKAVKAADADRVARRLAKKKARMAMGTSKDSGTQEEKKRERVRKGSGRTSGGVGTTRGKVEGKKKPRVRSDKSLEKRNAKK